MSNIPRFPDFHQAIKFAGSLMPSTPVTTQRWQGVDVSERPEMQMHEVEHFSFMVDTCGIIDLDVFRNMIRPNLPWADDHFLERVCGLPINPGVEWANWPGSDSAANFLDDNGKFNHNYMERYWPRYAGYATGPTSNSSEYAQQLDGRDLGYPNAGIYHQFGDLDGVVRHLANEPYTRQAYLPVWFPEDTGDVHSDRKPCTLGYHFFQRDGRLDITYYIRSCDYTRHFRDDIYLTIRLQLWMLERCVKRNPEFWQNVRLGRYIMHITSLHMFRNDYLAMKNNA